MVRRTLPQIREIAQKYAATLKEKGIHPKKIILFGSYSNGTAKPYSDIDLVVISNDFKKMNPLKRLEFLSLATKFTNAPLEILGYTPDEIRKNGKKSVFWSEIQKHAKVVYQ